MFQSLKDSTPRSKLLVDNKRRCLVFEGFNSNCTLALFLSSNTGKTTEITTALMAGTAETATIIVGMEIVTAAIEIGVVDLAETETMIVGPVIAMAEIASVVIATAEIATAEIATVEIATAEIATAEIASAVIGTAVIATVVIAIGVADMAETVTMIVGTEIVIATMIAEVANVLVTEIGDVTMMTVTVSEAHGVTVGVTVTVVEMQEAILIETRGSQVRK